MKNNYHTLPRTGLLPLLLLILLLPFAGMAMASNNDVSTPGNGTQQKRSGLPMNPGDGDDDPGKKSPGKKQGNKDKPGKGKNASGKVRVIKRSILKMPNLRGQRVRFVSKKIRTLEVYGQ